MEEFTVEDGEARLIKRKVTRREIPPDLRAVKLLMDSGGEPSDEELEAEKTRLLNMLKEDNFDG